ncbi:sensor histidine kinase [Sphingobacterium sp. MYb382]|uniref:sensor histidine kinase n=1 Tax=Sphingobacterium sp. MYb382 TaxID=2745278 RepID=UPI00309AE0AA
MKRIFESKWRLEISLLVLSFVLFTLNDWILISSWRGFFLGIVYFMVLYSHAQINRFLLLPLLTKRQKVSLYTTLSLILILVFTLILHYLSNSDFYRQCFLHNNPIKTTPKYQFGVILGSAICILGSTLFFEYYQNQRITAKREITSNISQIDFLTKQLNPHFLFNTLNTIYGVSLRYPEKTSELILKVSELLRYQVENTKKERVAIESEVEFILSYIELQKERVGYRTQIDFNYDIDEHGPYHIHPMLLFNFIENAFKHGTCNIEDCFIHITLTVKKGLLTLCTSNSVPHKKPKILSTHVGIENTKSRLEMLYAERHSLSIHAEKSLHNVLLHINLS